MSSQGLRAAITRAAEAEAELMTIDKSFIIIELKAELKALEARNAMLFKTLSKVNETTYFLDNQAE